MVNRMQFYIDGAWVDPVVKKSTPVVNPATEEAMYEVALGSKADVDKAVAAARRAFETFSQTSREERVALLAKIIDVYKTRMKDIGAAVSDEMGAPLPMAEKLQAGAGLGHIASTLGAEGVSIEQMVQEGRALEADDAVPVCIITHRCQEGAVRRAVKAIETKPFLKGSPRILRIEDV